MNKLINDFNKDDVVLVVSDYPQEGRGEKNHGIAWYTKQLLEPLAKNYNLKFVVLGEKGRDNEPKTYQNGKILVLRVFDKKHFSLFPSILKMLLTFSKIKKVDVHSEFCATGGIKNLILLLPFLFLIKINRCQITYFAHNVVKDLNSFAPHLGFKKKSLKVKILNFGLKFYYKALSLLINRFVVMDEVIYDRLSGIVNPKKISLNPFWIENKKTKLSKESSRQKLNVAKDDFLLLYFGFITYYKGADWIIKAVKKIRSKNKFKNISLILAGGEAYSLKNNTYYQGFYRSLLRLTKNDKHIRITGFVAEKDLPTYFKAADVVVLPYRGIMGASGCLSHAIAYQKPFIISDKMKMMTKNQDFKQALSETQLEPKNIVFSYNNDSFASLIEFLQTPKNLKKTENLSKNLASKRNIANLIDICYKNLYQEKITTSYKLAHLLSDLAAKA
jgi:glycosyltransferase involved in cell wall biosynthesis